MPWQQNSRGCGLSQSGCLMMSGLIDPGLGLGDASRGVNTLIEVAKRFADTSGAAFRLELYNPTNSHQEIYTISTSKET